MKNKKNVVHQDETKETVIKEEEQVTLKDLKTRKRLLKNIFEKKIVHDTVFFLDRDIYEKYNLLIDFLKKKNIKVLNECPDYVFGDFEIVIKDRGMFKNCMYLMDYFRMEDFEVSVVSKRWVRNKALYSCPIMFGTSAYVLRISIDSIYFDLNKSSYYEQENEYEKNLC